jgi:hypothetical protein
MICYRDSTFCTDTPDCAHMECHRRLTDEVKAKAEAFGLPVAVMSRKDSCLFYVPIKVVDARP